MSERPKSRVRVDDPQAIERLLGALRTRTPSASGLVRVTRADAVALAGIPAAQAEPALKALARDYRSHLAVTDSGELIWAFDPSFERRDRVPLGERLQAAGRALWSACTLLFKAWIAVTLVVYVVAFVAMMIALVFARQGDDRDDRRGGGGGDLFWVWWWLMPDLAPRYHGPARLAPRRPQKRFYRAVFDFVFGPPVAALDPREADRRLVAFLRAHRGQVSASELSALTGLSLSDAEQELTRLLSEFDGDVEVADDGTLLYSFRDLLVTTETSALTPASWSWSWQREELQPPLTGNSPGTNAAIGGFAGFNLLASLTIGPVFLMRMGLWGHPLAQLLVTTVPLVFSALFLGIPAVRALGARRARRSFRARRVRRQLHKRIMHSVRQKEEGVDPAQLTETVAQATGASLDEVKQALEELHRELEGDLHTTDGGAVRYTFPRLAEEDRAIAQARLAAPAAPRLGEVLFSSEEEPDSLETGGRSDRTAPTPVRLPPREVN